MKGIKIWLGLLGVTALSCIGMLLIQSGRKKKELKKYIKEAQSNSFVQDILRAMSNSELSYSKKEDINVHYRCTLESYKSSQGFSINRLTSYGPMSTVSDFYVEFQGNQVEKYADYLFSHAVYLEQKRNKS